MYNQYYGKYIFFCFQGYKDLANLMNKSAGKEVFQFKYVHLWGMTLSSKPFAPPARTNYIEGSLFFHRELFPQFHNKMFQIQNQ